MTGPLPCRFLDIPESAENLPKSEKMKFRQVGGTGTVRLVGVITLCYNNQAQPAPKEVMKP